MQVNKASTIACCLVDFYSFSTATISITPNFIGEFSSDRCDIQDVCNLSYRYLYSKLKMFFSKKRSISHFHTFSASGFRWF